MLPCCLDYCAAPLQYLVLLILRIGYFLGGKFFDTYNTQVTCIVTQVISVFTMVLTPIGGSIVLAYAMSFITGLGLGAFDTGTSKEKRAIMPN